jgi:hypothetical protein
MTAVDLPVVVDANGCKVWTGRRDANGYARWGGQWAHRRVYVLECGPIPDGHELDHTCQNPPCVNVEHLEPVTKAEHARRTMERLGKDRKHLSAAYLRSLGMTYADVAELMEYTSRSSAADAVRRAVHKGLIAADEVPAADRLTDEDADDIVALRNAGVPVREIAGWYGIHESHASRVSRGLTSRSLGAAS